SLLSWLIRRLFGLRRFDAALVFTSSCCSAKKGNQSGVKPPQSKGRAKPKNSPLAKRSAAMSVLRKRVSKLALTALILAAAFALAFKRSEPPVWTFRVVLGIDDKKPTDWSGKIEIADGEVVAIEGWRFEGKDQVDATTGWTCQTRDYIAFGQRSPVQLADGTPRVKEPVQPWPNGVTLTLQGNAPKVSLKLAQGVEKFDAAEVKVGEPLTALNGRVKIERMPRTSLVRPAAKPPTDNAVQDDYPAFWVHYKSGKQYLAWVAYHIEKDR